MCVCQPILPEDFDTDQDVDNFLQRWKNFKLLFKYQEIIFKVWLFLFHHSFKTLFETGVLEEAS